MHIITVLGNSTYDKWPPEENFRPPMISESFQRELNRIGGFVNSLPHLRLEWGSICTWTPYVKELKYQYSRQTRQTAWGVHVRDTDGNIVKTLRFPLKSKDIPEPSEIYGLAFPMNVIEEIGIPRWWISQYQPPTLLGDWDQCRRDLKREIGHDADMGECPREGMYYLGFHGLWEHDANGTCCERAKELGLSRCFGYYRDPSELDLEYVRWLWRERQSALYHHKWYETSSAEDMASQLLSMAKRHKDVGLKEREAMRLRIRDAFRTHKGRLLSRKGRSTFILTPGC